MLQLKYSITGDMVHYTELGEFGVKTFNVNANVYSCIYYTYSKLNY